MAETQPGRLASACVESATLAAFVDGTLTGPDRASVVAHLASCPDCAELVGEVIAVGDVVAAESADPLRPTEPLHHDRPLSPKTGWNGRRGIAAVGGIVALAASLVLVLLNRSAPLASLVSVVGDERLTVARPTGGFRYGPLRSPVRGPRQTASASLLSEAARLRQYAAETGAAADLHASGVADVLAGEAASGVAVLESAARATPGAAAVQVDLGAAYMTRFVEAGDAADGASALAAFDRAIALEPASHEAWFNKAVLLERLERTSDALSAWNRYLALPAEPGWRDDALRQRDALQAR